MNLPTPLAPDSRLSPQVAQITCSIAIYPCTADCGMKRTCVSNYHFYVRNLCSLFFSCPFFVLYTRTSLRAQICLLNEKHPPPRQNRQILIAGLLTILTIFYAFRLISLIGMLRFYYAGYPHQAFTAKRTYFRYSVPPIPDRHPPFPILSTSQPLQPTLLLYVFLLRLFSSNTALFSQYIPHELPQSAHILI